MGDKIFAADGKAPPRFAKARHGDAGGMRGAVFHLHLR